MSIGEGEITDILEHDPKSRAGCKNLTPQIELGRVIQIILDGGGPPEIQKKLRIPYAIALAVFKNAFPEVWGCVPDLKSPEVLAGIKDDNVNELQFSIHVLREEEDLSLKAGKLNVKATNSKKDCIKQLANMLGHNAPTLSANLNVATTLVHPADQQAWLRSEPEVREQTLRENADRRLSRWPQPEGGGGE